MAKKLRKRRRSQSERKLARRMLAKLRKGMDLRRGKVRYVRAAIATRSYENQLKLEVTVDRLLAELKM